MKTLIIFYLVFLNGVLLAQYGQGYPNGHAYNSFNSMTNSDSTPEQKRRRDERRAQEEAATRGTRDTGLDIRNDLCEKEKISMLEKANSEYEAQLIKSVECQKNNTHKKYKNIYGEFDSLTDYWFNMITWTIIVGFIGGLFVILFILLIANLFMKSDGGPMCGE